MMALPQYRTSSLFSAQEKLVLELADAMTETPVEVPEPLFQQLQGQFTEAQLVELTASLAWENFRARMYHALGMESENFAEGSFCALPVEGEHT